jgi:transcriptional regulator with XRE-family HTH domain
MTTSLTHVIQCTLDSCRRQRTLAESMDPLPFSKRLQELLRQRGLDGSQAWLSERSGVDRSLISRIITGERPPTAETLQALAPALGVEVSALVAGTDAARRLSAVADHVRRSDYEEAVGKVIEYEAKIRDLEARRRSLDDQLTRERETRRHAEQDANMARATAERSEQELLELREQHETQSSELSRHREALQRAISEFSTLKSRVTELERELGETKKSSRASALLAGVAAVTGVATLAHFLGDTPPPQPQSRPRKGTK